MSVDGDVMDVEVMSNKWLVKCSRSRPGINQNKFIPAASNLAPCVSPPKPSKPLGLAASKQFTLVCCLYLPLDRLEAAKTHRVVLLGWCFLEAYQHRMSYIYIGRLFKGQSRHIFHTWSVWDMGYVIQVR